jgi:hypothetical protein
MPKGSKGYGSSKEKPAATKGAKKAPAKATVKKVKAPGKKGA